ncbi:MAG: hypothetical protein HC850_02345 [Rhodomicrobium sp.]|nr:hypothetical protein [Rhodomicrobium sp.]
MAQDSFGLIRPDEQKTRKFSFAGLASLLASSSQTPKQVEPIGVELHNLIAALSQCGRDVQSIADPVLAVPIGQVVERIEAVSCRIAVVGQVKAGKSSFINAIMQRGDLLPTHVNPWTAVATRLHFGMPGKPIAGCDFSFFSAGEWTDLGLKATVEGVDEFEDGFEEMKQRAELRLGGQFYHLLGKSHFYQSVQANILQNYLCAGPPVTEVSREIKPGRYADITKSANVYFPLPPLAVPAILIDTPGTNDATHLRYRITREIIEGADIYIVVLTARQQLTSSDLGLLKVLQALDKKRIIVFVNRIDELNERAGDTDLIVNRVRDDLDKLFGEAPIPIVVGSAKWAGLAGLDDGIEQLYREAATPGFMAVAARKGLPVNARSAANSALAALQKSFRAASGIDSIGTLLSLLMLSGFVTNHARGGVDALLSAAEMSAYGALRDLKAMAQPFQNAAEAARQIGDSRVTPNIAEINALLDKIEIIVQSARKDARPAIMAGIGRMEALLESDIRLYAASDKPAADGKTGGWSFGTRPGTGILHRGTRSPDKKPPWLIAVREVTLDILRRTSTDARPVEEPEAVPTSMRRASLTVPVTGGAKAVTMNSGGSWWSEWIKKLRSQDKDGGELPGPKPLLSIEGAIPA